MSLRGNVLVAQSGGPTSVINSSVAGVIQTAMKSKEIGSIFGATNGVLGVLREDLFDISLEKPQIIEALRSTPAAAIGSCRYKLKDLQQSQMSEQETFHLQ